MIKARELVSTGAVLLILILLATIGPGAPAWAQPGVPAQTVPTPTPTKQHKPEPLPTATPANPTPTPTDTPIPSSPETSPTPAAPVAIPRGDMNVREGPSTERAIIGTANAGQPYPILGRNAEGDWWAIEYEGRTGWLYAPLTQTQGDISAIPVLTEAPPPTPTPTPTDTPQPLPELALDLTTDPPWAIPGREVAFQLTISNTSAIDAEGVTVRDELPPVITPGEVQAPQGTSEQTGQIVEIALGTVAAGSSVELTIMGIVAPDAPPGEIIDNIIEVATKEGLRLSIGVSIPLPPAYLPPTGAHVPTSRCK